MKLFKLKQYYAWMIKIQNDNIFIEIDVHQVFVEEECELELINKIYFFLPCYTPQLMLYYVTNTYLKKSFIYMTISFIIIPHKV